MVSLRFSCISYCIILFCITAFPQSLETRIEKSILPIFIQKETVGLSVAIVRNNRIIYANCWGNKKLKSAYATEIPMKLDDLYRIASITKTFVATAIMQLKENGKLSLDDDAGRYLSFKLRNPSYPNIPITIRMLLSHRSSINDSRGYYSFDLLNSSKNTHSYAECYNDYPPGKSYQYCNFNYNLLGAIIENVSSERFDEYTSNHIFSPLNIEGGFDVDKLDSNRFVSLYKYDENENCFYESKEAYKSYRNIFKSYKLGYTTPLLSPAGGLKITVYDLALYMLEHMKASNKQYTKLLSYQSEKELQDVQTQSSNYALSFRRYTNIVKGDTLYGQTGGAYGLFSAMIFSPKKDIGFVILTNGCKSHYIDGFMDFHLPIIRRLYALFIE